MINDYSDIWYIEYLDRRPDKCCNCAFANEYLLPYWFPYYNPTCSKGHACKPDKDACKDFKLIGRHCR